MKKTVLAVSLLLMLLLLAFQGVSLAATAHLIETYQTAAQTSTELQFTVGSKTYLHGPLKKTLDVPPFTREARTLIPIRYVVEALGGTISWNQETKETSMTISGTTILMQVGKATAIVNGVSKPIDSTNPKVMPILEKRRTFIPLRFVLESINAEVVWNPYTKTVTLRYPKPDSITFENSVFSVKYPANWVKAEDGLDVMFTSPENCIIGVNSEDLAAGTKTLAQYYAQNLKLINEGFKNVKVVEQTNATVSGLEARKITYTATSDGAPLKSTQVFFIKGNKGYTLTYAALVGLYINYTSAVDSAISSLSIKLDQISIRG